VCAAENLPTETRCTYSLCLTPLQVSRCFGSLEALYSGGVIGILYSGNVIGILYSGSVIGILYSGGVIGIHEVAGVEANRLHTSTVHSVWWVRVTDFMVPTGYIPVQFIQCGG
jgi:hypothetical protein